MTGCLLAIVLSFVVMDAGAAEPAPAPTPSLRARLTDDVVKQAVRETLAEGPREPKDAPSGRVLSGDRYQSFARTFSEAQIPSCLRPDALKHQPNKIDTKDWHFEANGTLALPFWAAAIVRGKCK
jgi:hypothetical protein